MKKIAIVVSRFNAQITEGLLAGAKKYLLESGFSEKELDTYRAPGAFEIPILAQKLARSGRYSGVVCLGSVVKGDTAHFEFISLGSSLGIMNTMLETQTPITFGILTTYTQAQAIQRSRADESNKGIEAAAACLDVLKTLGQIEEGIIPNDSL